MSRAAVHNDDLLGDPAPIGGQDPVHERVDFVTVSCRGDDDGELPLELVSLESHR